MVDTIALQIRISASCSSRGTPREQVSENRALNCLGRLPFRLRRCVRIHVCGCADIGVAEERLRELQVTCLVINQTGCGMTERVESGTAFWARNGQPVENWIKNILAENVRIQRRAIPLAKEEILRPDMRGLL